MKMKHSSSRTTNRHKKLKLEEETPTFALTCAMSSVTEESTLLRSAGTLTEVEEEEGGGELVIVAETGVEAVERILGYTFRDKSLIDQALTHSSYTESASYQRLEFVGDAALGLALANFVFIKYPDLDPGQLSLLRSANISTEKLARVAVRHGLYKYMRHSAPSLDLKVREFTLAVEEEGDEVLPYGGSVKAPKVLADIVESIAAAIYVDCNFNLKFLWEYFSPLLEPIVTLENLQQQPVTMLYEVCQKQGKHVDFKHWRKGEKNICDVFVDGKILGAGCSEQKDIAKLAAAKEALQTLNNWECALEVADADVPIGMPEIPGAKQKLNEFCDKKRWRKPTYRVDKEVGPSHDKRYICSVHIETANGIYIANGDMKPKVKDGESSAASMMLHSLNGGTSKVK